MWLLLSTLCLTCANAFLSGLVSSYLPNPEPDNAGMNEPGSYTQGDTGIYQNYYPDNNFCRYPPCPPPCRYPPCNSPSNDLQNTIHNYSPNNNNFNTYSPSSRSGTGSYTKGDTGIYQNVYPDNNFCRYPPCPPPCRYPPCPPPCRYPPCPPPCRYPPCNSPSNDLQNTIHNYSPNNNNFNTYSPSSRSGTGSYTKGDTGIYQNVYPDNNFCRYPPCPTPCRYPPCPPPCRYPPCNSPSNDLQNTIHNYSPNNNNLNMYSPSSRSGTGSYTQGDTGIYQNFYPDNNFCRYPPCPPPCRYPPCPPPCRYPPCPPPCRYPPCPPPCRYPPCNSPSNDLQNTIHNYSPNNNNLNMYSPSSRSGTGSYTQGDTGIYQNFYPDNNFCRYPPCPPPCRYPPCPPPCRYPPCKSPSHNLQNTIHSYSPNNNNLNIYSPSSRSGTGSYTQGDTGIYQNFYPDNNFCRYPPCPPPCRYPPCPPPCRYPPCPPPCRYPPCSSSSNDLQNTIHNYSPNNNNFNTYSPSSRSGTGSYTKGDTGIYQNYYPDNSFCREPPCIPCRYPPCPPPCRYPPCIPASHNLKNTIHSYSPNNNNFNVYSPSSRSGTGSYTQGDTGIYQNYYPDSNFCREPPCPPPCRFPPCPPPCRYPPCPPPCRYPPCPPPCRYPPCNSPSNDLQNTIHNYSPNNNNFNTYSPSSRSGAGSYTQGDTGIYQNYYPDSNFCREPPCPPPCRFPPCPPPCRYPPCPPPCRYPPCPPPCRYPPCPPPCRYPPCNSPLNDLQNTIHNYSPNNNNFNTYTPSSGSRVGSNVHSYRRTNNAPQSRRKGWYMDAPFEVDYFYKLPVIKPKTDGESSTYVEDLKRIDLFGKYLLYRTETDQESSDTPDDAIYEYNALFTVLIALAQAIRNSCDDFEQVYEQVYYPTVDKYYQYGLDNADKIPRMIEDYIDKGTSRMPKLRKLAQQFCTTESDCSEAIEEFIKSSPHVYIKELETLEALSHLATSFYPYIEEFDQAANNGTVLEYLKNSKDRLKEYVKHMVNSVDHLTDGSVTCD